jgi:glutamine amidotransferase PdxT
MDSLVGIKPHRSSPKVPSSYNLHHLGNRFYIPMYVVFIKAPLFKLILRNIRVLITIAVYIVERIFNRNNEQCSSN